jgi:hypothetical protein
MNQFTKATFLTICTALTPATPVMANVDTIAVMEEIFDVMWASAGSAEVGDKVDSGRSTRWADIVISNGDEGPVMNLPWIEVSKKLLGDYVVTMAPTMTITGELPKGEGKISGAITHSGLEMTVGGSKGSRVFDAAFGQVDMTMTMGNVVDMTMTMSDGVAKTEINGDVMNGTFEYPTLNVQYALDIEGQKTETAFTMMGTKGKYRSPILKSQDLSAWQSLWADGSKFFVDYGADSMTMKMAAPSPAGNVNVEATGGAMTGRMAAIDGVVSSGGEVVDLVYNVSAMGMPPMKVTIDKTDSLIAMPLDNVDTVKPAQMKMALTGLELDPMIWAMFDPQGQLPKDKANLEIDLSGDVKWAQKIADIDVTGMATGLPVQFENAKITALNLDALGATLTTTGTFDIDSTKFPPAASGQADIAIVGVNALMSKLTEAGLLPAQNAMMAKGMMGMFFKENGGPDKLTSQIVVSPDGSISANGFPLK